MLNDEPHYNVLFLCTGNSARSIIAEAIMNRLGAPRFRAYSAGSQPKGEVHPYTIDLLRSLNHNVDDFRSKSWEEFAAPGAPELDFVFTVCDSAASEVCPIWPGQPMTAHWGVEDPAAVSGDDEQKHAAVMKAFIQLKRRIELFLALPMTKLDNMSLQKSLDDIGQQKD